MKKFKLLVGLLLTAILAFSVGVGTFSAFADIQEIEKNAIVSQEEDFDGKSVIVTMTEEVSEVNMAISTVFISITGCKSVDFV